MAKGSYAQTIRVEVPLVAQSLDYTCGAACFASLYQYFSRSGCGEMYFAEQLGTLALGYTPPENIVALAKTYGFRSELSLDTKFSSLKKMCAPGTVVLVTWWDEDAGHYSIVKQIERTHIVLMDPWTARKGLDNRLPLKDFLSFWRLRGKKMISVTRL